MFRFKPIEDALIRASRMLFAVLTIMSIAGCAAITTRSESSVRCAQSLPAEQRPSPNFDTRRPNFVIIHHTSDKTAEEALNVLTDPGAQVSAHYLIGRDGRLFQLVDEGTRAWHAGESYWGGQQDVNSASIGIELDNDGFEPFSARQIDALLALLGDLKSRYNIPSANFLGHADVAPGRKTDPSRLFPWAAPCATGFRLVVRSTVRGSACSRRDRLLLQAFGYNVWNVDAAMSAFKLHFVPDDSSPSTQRKRPRTTVLSRIAETRRFRRIVRFVRRTLPKVSHGHVPPRHHRHAPHHFRRAPRSRHAGFTILEAGGNAVDAGVRRGYCGRRAADRIACQLRGASAPMMIYLAEVDRSSTSTGSARGRTPSHRTTS
jgi:N-acetylmuramoyl-L-alanine amidase